MDDEQIIKENLARFRKVYEKRPSSNVKYAIRLYERVLEDLRK